MRIDWIEFPRNEAQNWIKFLRATCTDNKKFSITKIEIISSQFLLMDPDIVFDSCFTKLTYKIYRENCMAQAKSMNPMRDKTTFYFLVNSISDSQFYDWENVKNS